MNFLAPLAFFFAVTIPVVILFYLLKRRRVVRVVPSTLLWQKFLAETQASAPFQKLRKNWLLILQILLLVLAVLALSRPYLAGKSSGGRLVVVILDASASMQATDEAPTRFAKARADALKLVDALHDEDRMVVLEVGANTEVKQSATSEKAALRRALNGIEARDTPTRLKEALKLAETLVQKEARPEVHLFSDGAVGGLEDFESTGLPLVFHQVGRRANNVAITALDVRSNPENPLQRAVFANIVNYSTNSQTLTLEFLAGGEIKEVKPLTLAPGETSPQVFITTQERDGVFEVRMDARDDLLLDNRAAVVSLLPQPTRVLLVSVGNRLLEKALRAATGVDLSIARSLDGTESSFDIVVLDGVLPERWPEGNLLIFNVAPPAWFPSVGRQSTPAIVDWKGNHPLLRFVSFDNVQIAESLVVKTPPWGLSLVESPQSPLVIAGETGRQRVAWVGFDSLGSTWPLRFSFPIFIANAVEWLSPSAINASQLTVRSGEPFRLALAEKTTGAVITTPDGSKVTVPVDPARGEVLFGATARQGIYRLQAGTNEVSFCVNLTDATESNLEPKSELRFGKYSKAAAIDFRNTNLEIWRWIALGALAVLLFEWWYYHRRTA